MDGCYASLIGWFEDESAAVHSEISTTAKEKPPTTIFSLSFILEHVKQLRLEFIEGSVNPESLPCFPKFPREHQHPGIQLRQAPCLGFQVQVSQCGVLHQYGNILHRMVVHLLNLFRRFHVLSHPQQYLLALHQHLLSLSLETWCLLHISPEDRVRVFDPPLIPDQSGHAVLFVTFQWTRHM